MVEMRAPKTMISNNEIKRPDIDDVEIIREKARRSELSFTGHAIVEGRKEGITPQEVKSVLTKGKIIEKYPERYRCLVYGVSSDNIPVHILCEYYDYLIDEKEDIVVVTVYVPSNREWIAGQVRRKWSRKKR